MYLNVHHKQTSKCLATLLVYWQHSRTSVYRPFDWLWVSSFHWIDVCDMYRWCDQHRLCAHTHTWPLANLKIIYYRRENTRLIWYFCVEHGILLHKSLIALMYSNHGLCGNFIEEHASHNIRSGVHRCLMIKITLFDIW